MKIIDLNGTAFERGVAQGETLRGAWKKMESDFFRSSLLAEAKPAIIPNFVVRLGLGALGLFRTRDVVRRRLPSMFDRVIGLAKGLGITRPYAWGLQYMEILFCIAGDSLAIPNAGCTQAHADPRATADGRPLTGRNYDFPNMLRGHQIIRRETPFERGRLATMTVTQVPLIGAHQGINEAGLVACINNNRVWRSGDINHRGVPSLMLLEETLETCSTVGQAVDFMTQFPERGHAGFLGLMDASGDCRVVEFTASRFSVRKPDDAGILAQANHFIDMTEANLPAGTVWKVKGMEGVEYADSTNKRYEVANRRLHEFAGKITVESLMSILRDHSANANGEGDLLTVCNHGEKGSTLASFITDPREKIMWAAEGTPCNSEYKKIEFRNR